MKVVYPVLFYEEEENYSIFVPDINNSATCGKDLAESMEMAEDLIAGLILDIMEEGKKIPEASKIEDISFAKLEKDLEIKDIKCKSKFKTYISVDISKFAEKWGKELVKKTVNIPKWVNTRAEEMKINFSKTLEEALLERIYKN